MWGSKHLLYNVMWNAVVLRQDWNVFVYLPLWLDTCKLCVWYQTYHELCCYHRIRPNYPYVTFSIIIMYIILLLLVKYLLMFFFLILQFQGEMRLCVVYVSYCCGNSNWVMTLHGSCRGRHKWSHVTYKLYQDYMWLLCILQWFKKH